MTTRRGGRKTKGERKPSMVRFPVEHYAVYEAAARAEGLALGDYVAREMALRLGLDLPDHLQEQAQLPLAKAS